jgi:DNA-binding response OmpR family regulator
MQLGGGSAVWSSAAAGRFDWRLWGDEIVVYVLATGCTHELSPAASGVLAALLRQPGVALTEGELLSELSAPDDFDEEELSPESRDIEAQTLRELLAHMNDMGLIDQHQQPRAS